MAKKETMEMIMKMALVQDKMVVKALGRKVVKVVRAEKERKERREIKVRREIKEIKVRRERKVRKVRKEAVEEKLKMVTIALAKKKTVLVERKVEKGVKEELEVKMKMALIMNKMVVKALGRKVVKERKERRVKKVMMTNMTKITRVNKELEILMARMEMKMEGTEKEGRMRKVQENIIKKEKMKMIMMRLHIII